MLEWSFPSLFAAAHMQNTNTHIRDLDLLPVSTLFWRYAIPSIAGMLVTGLYAVIDGVFVGHYVGSHLLYLQEI